MSWRGPFDLYDSTPSDWVMMEEVLDLLVSENTSSHEIKFVTTSNNNQDGQAGDVRLSGIAATCKQAVSKSNENELLDRDEEKCPVKQEQEPLDQAQPMRNSIPSTLQLIDTVSKRRSFPAQQLMHSPVQKSFAADACYIDFVAAPESAQILPAPVQEPFMARETITFASIPVSPPASILHQSLQHSQLPRKSLLTWAAHPNPDSNVLSTGQRVRVINSVEFEELRRKVQMQTASRRYRKRKKEATRHKKMCLQELQDELSRLQYMEAQTKQYQQRSVESLQQELKMHQDELMDLSGKIQEAAREELDWVMHLPE